MNANWHNASKSHPCPVCGHRDWCTISNDGAVAVCRRVPSPKPARSGIGWVHFLKDAPNRPRRPTCPAGFESQVWASPKPAEPSSSELSTLHSSLSSDPVFLDEMAMRLGVTFDSLWRLDLRRDARGNAAFPMKDGEGTVTGIRLRNPSTGRKWSVKGSRDGLFYARGFESERHEELVVLEGPSDAAAAISAGLPAVGRSSCLTGAPQLRELARRCRVRRVTIVADLDAPKPRPGGGTWRPGLDGAKRLGRALGLPFRIVLPPPGIKDFRDWRALTGMCPAKFWGEAAAAFWQGPYTKGER